MSVRISIKNGGPPVASPAPVKAKGRFSVWEGICSFFSAIARFFGFEQTATMDDLKKKDVSREAPPVSNKTDRVAESSVKRASQTGAQPQPQRKKRAHSPKKAVHQNPEGTSAAPKPASQPQPKPNPSPAAGKTSENKDPNPTHSKEIAQAKELLAKVSAIVKKEDISEDDVEAGLEMIKQLRELNKTMNNEKLGRLIDGKEMALNNADVLNAIAEAQGVLSVLGAKGDNLTVQDIENGLRVINNLQKLDVNMDREMNLQLIRIKSELLDKYREPAIEASNKLIPMLIDVIRDKPQKGDNAVLEAAKKWNELMKSSYNYTHLDRFVNALERKVASNRKK